jgi:hypothetical protein
MLTKSLIAYLLQENAPTKRVLHQNQQIFCRVHAKRQRRFFFAASYNLL